MQLASNHSKCRVPAFIKPSNKNVAAVRTHRTHNPGIVFALDSAHSRGTSVEPPVRSLSGDIAKRPNAGYRTGRWREESADEK
jgi:hypothetical protein